MSKLDSRGLGKELDYLVAPLAEGEVWDAEKAEMDAYAEQNKGVNDEQIQKKIDYQKQRLADLRENQAWDKDTIAIVENIIRKSERELQRRQEERGAAETYSEANVNADDAMGKLSKQEAEGVVAKMEATAEADPEIELSEDSWNQTFGLRNSISTPIGEVKMGENQYSKLLDKNRSQEFGMVVRTLEDPDVILIEPSQAKDGQITERDYSYVFVKTFIRVVRKLNFMPQFLFREMAWKFLLAVI